MCIGGGKDQDSDAILCRGASSGSIKSLPASVRQPLGFRTMYNSMHGEQIELRQAYAGALGLSGAAPRAPMPTCTSSAMGAPEQTWSQVGPLVFCLFPFFFRYMFARQDWAVLTYNRSQLL